MANTLRAAGVRPADYQAYVLPLLMYKVINDRVDADRERTIAEDGEQFWGEYGETLAPFVIPPGANFATVRGAEANLGERLTEALIATEETNGELAGIFLRTDYGKLSDKAVTELLQTLAGLTFDPAAIADDALGVALEYLLGKFADAAGAKAGQFFTPPAVAELLATIVAPQPGETALDPTCGSGGLLNQVAQYVANHGGSRGSVALYGQELDEQTAALARVNLFLHSDQGEIVQDDTLLAPGFTTGDGLRLVDCAVANPPFGMVNTMADTWPTDRYGRNKWGPVVRKPSELAFVAHIASSLRPHTGRAAVVLPMGALFRKGAEATMRKNLLEAGYVSAVIQLPEKLFYNTGIPASILVLRTEPRPDGTVLFVDASDQFESAKKQNVLTDVHIDRIATAARGGETSLRTIATPIADVVAAGADLTPSRWLPAAEVETVDVDAALLALHKAQVAAEAAEKDLWKHLKAAGYAVPE